MRRKAHRHTGPTAEEEAEVLERVVICNKFAGRPRAGAGFKHMKFSARAAVSLLCRAVHSSDNNTGLLWLVMIFKK